MPLALLAKDSIVDLVALGKEAEAERNQRFSFPDEHGGEGDETGLLLEDDDHHTENSFPSTNQELAAPVADEPSHRDPADKPARNAVPAPANSGSSTTSYGSYSGFSLAYQDSYLYTSGGSKIVSYPSIVKPNFWGGFWQSLLPCLFPWTTHETPPPMLLQDSIVSPDVEDKDNSEKGDASVERKAGRCLENDDVSTGSEALGEKLSERDRQAVLARLRLAQPQPAEDNSDSDFNPSNQKRGLLNDLPKFESPPADSVPKQPGENGQGPKKIRGILKKHRSVVNPSLNSERGDNRDSMALKNPPKRRSLFPQVSYDTIGSGSEKNAIKKRVSFAPMARVVTVKSRNDMDEQERGAIWWLKPDYDDFRKTGRIITQAMMQGGSEVWLNSERCTGKSKVKNSPSSPEGEQDESPDSLRETGDKWWHKFGHSRRGLEHVVSIEEGRERQVNVRNAIRAVIDEQHRQEMYKKWDPEKLRMVSLQYTSWARDLALASGSSDADAVRSSFSDERKTREFYLLKLNRMKKQESNSSAVVRHTPDFMKPALFGTQAQIATTPQRLDANTASAQIRIRRLGRMSQQQTAVAKLGTTTTTTPVTSTSSLSSASDGNGSSGVVSLGSEEQSEPVHDRVADDETSMARRAAGFSASDQKVDMAAVLSGMGVVPRSSQVVSTA